MLSETIDEGSGVGWLIHGQAEYPAGNARE